VIDRRLSCKEYRLRVRGKVVVASSNHSIGDLRAYGTYNAHKRGSTGNFDMTVTSGNIGIVCMLHIFTDGGGMQAMLPVALQPYNLHKSIVTIAFIR
jgi:hypothetical protein